MFLSILRSISIFNSICCTAKYICRIALRHYWNFGQKPFEPQAQNPERFDISGVEGKIRTNLFEISVYFSIN